ncbi:MAG TPA: SRPBCC family protein [Homoserinimonas sp.]|nr:SRPBCC family protein [Homoserinimonas sp.]
MTSKNPTTITAEPGVPYIEIVREFDAPKDAVRRAYIDRDLVGQWLGPRGYQMEIKEWNAETGGRYQYTHRDQEGNAFGFSGVFHSVGDDALVQTFEFDGWPGHVSLESLVFEDLGGRTRVRNHSVYQSVEDRDGMVDSGMEKGLNEGYERLDELLAAAPAQQ